MRKHFFHGDTLIEVAIAIAIFSLVAISIVAVINTSTSGIQTSLETTMARNEIDAQAEALRFIHDAYEAEKDLSGSQQTYSSLWREITDLATNNKNLTITDFSPTTCSTLYEQNTTSPDYVNSIFYQNAFIINPKLLNSTTTQNTDALIIAKSDSNPPIFTTTPLYPRLFNGNNELALIAEDFSSSNGNLSAQGIYIIPTIDQGTYTNGDINTKVITYYDFYIRTCWYSAGADTPSTISTVIRLYSPDMDVVDNQLIDYALIFETGTNETTVPTKTRTVRSTETTFSLETNDYTKKTNNASQKLLGWAKKGITNPCGNAVLSNADAQTLWGITSNQSTITLYSNEPNVALSPIWECTYSLTYTSVGDTTNMPPNYSNTINQPFVRYTISNQTPSRPEYRFGGWKDTSTNKTYQKNETINLGINITGYKQSITLSAIWHEPYIIIYNANNGSFVDASGTASATQTQKCLEIDCVLSSVKPTRSGYRFSGWATSKNATSAQYSPNDTVQINANTTLYAVWKEQNETITVKLYWCQAINDLDSHFEGYKSDNTTFKAYYYEKTQLDTGKILAQLDNDVVSGCGTETFILNTLGGKDYYYYVYNFSGESSIPNTNATVTVSGGSLTSRTYDASCASGYYSDRYWNIFAYKNGTIVDVNGKCGSLGDKAKTFW